MIQINSIWLQKLQYIGHSQIPCALHQPFMYVFWLCMSGCLFSSVMALLVKEFLSERRALVVVAEFLTATLFFKVGRLDSILMLHSLDHIGAPSISRMALFYRTAKEIHWVSVMWVRVGAP